MKITKSELKEMICEAVKEALKGRREKVCEEADINNTDYESILQELEKYYLFNTQELYPKCERIINILVKEYGWDRDRIHYDMPSDIDFADLDWEEDQCVCNAFFYVLSPEYEDEVLDGICIYIPSNTAIKNSNEIITINKLLKNSICSDPEDDVADKNNIYAPNDWQACYGLIPDEADWRGGHLEKTDFKRFENDKDLAKAISAELKKIENRYGYR